MEKVICWQVTATTIPMRKRARTFIVVVIVIVVVVVVGLSEEIVLSEMGSDQIEWIEIEIEWNELVVELVRV